MALYIFSVVLILAMVSFMIFMGNQLLKHFESEGENKKAKIIEQQSGRIYNKKKDRKFNKKAIIGFVSSIISIFGIGLAGIIGFILGIIALRQINHSQERGKGLAKASIIVGFIYGFAVSILKRLI